MVGQSGGRFDGYQAGHLRQDNSWRASGMAPRDDTFPIPLVAVPMHIFGGSRGGQQSRKRNAVFYDRVNAALEGLNWLAGTTSTQRVSTLRSSIHQERADRVVKAIQRPIPQDLPCPKQLLRCSRDVPITRETV